MHSGEKPARFLSTILDTRNTRSPQHLQFTGSRSSWLRLLSFFLSFFLSLFLPTALLFWAWASSSRRKNIHYCKYLQLCLNILNVQGSVSKLVRSHSQSLLVWEVVLASSGHPVAKHISLTFILTMLIRCSRKPTYLWLCQSLENAESCFSCSMFCLTSPMLARLIVTSTECLIEPSFHLL